MHLHLHSARARYVSRGYSADQRRRESRRQAAQAKVLLISIRTQLS